MLQSTPECPDNGGRQQVWLLKQAAWLVASAFAMLLVFEASRLDLTLAGLFFDPSIHDFPLRTNGFLSGVMHHGLKMASYAMAVVAVGFCIYAQRHPLAWLPRRNALAAAVAMLVIPLGISALKLATNRHCPWDVIDFGGYAPYIGLLAGSPGEISRGACFPAGHAGAGYVWLIWPMVLMASRPQWARRLLLAVLLLGSLMGLARMAQGAHFLSHTLWSAWFAWAVSLLSLAVFRAELPGTGIADAQVLESALPTISATSDDRPSVPATLSRAARIVT